MTQRIRSGAIETIVEERVAEEAESRRLAAEAIARWERGEPADTQAVLASFPEVGRHASVVLDLAYEEYCQRVAAGESIDTASFCARFPQYSSQLSRLLEVHGFFDQYQPSAEVLPEADWPVKDERFLGFRIRDELGRGAIARVYLAEEPALGNRLVALKVAPHGENEAETLGKLPHPNIVPVFSVRQDDSGLTAVCMPYLGRTTIADIVAAIAALDAPPRSATVIRDTLLARNRGLPEPPAMSSSHATKTASFAGPYIDAVIRFGYQLAEALALTHAKGILHRDLKPSNVLVTPVGVPMLLDFNLSVDAHARASRVGGTLPYMSPEQIRQVFPSVDSTGAIDARSDIFSLGVILYELLTGSLPFGATTDESSPVTAMLLLSQQERGCQPLRSHNRLVDDRLATVVERCLAADLEKRPPSAGELATSLRATLAPQIRLRRSVMAHPWRASGLASTIAACVIAIAALFVTRDPYCVRQYNAGCLEYEQANYRPALAHFQNALNDNPTFVEARFRLALAWQHIDEHASAAAEFTRVFRETSDPNVAAGLSYSLACQGLYSAAVDWGLRAVDAGLARAAIYNNVGVSARKLGSDKLAQQCLDEAIKRCPDMQSALYNRALLAFNASRVRNQPVSRSSLHDIKRAAQLRPECAEILRLAALLQLAVGGDGPPSLDIAAEYLAKAITLGLDLAQVRNDPRFKPLNTHPNVASLLLGSNAAKAPTPAPLFVDPNADEPPPQFNR